MTVYVDLVFFLNLFFDFLLLLTVNNTLKRNTSLKRIFLGALVGSITIFTLFLSISSILLFVFKVVLSIVMCTITFGIISLFFKFNFGRKSLWARIFL